MHPSVPPWGRVLPGADHESATQEIYQQEGLREVHHLHCPLSFPRFTCYPLCVFSFLCRLEEMQEYCTNVSGCRRETFSSVFGGSGGFRACGNMCDNCLSKRRGGGNGGGREQPRHSFISPSEEGGLDPSAAGGRGRGEIFLSSRNGTSSEASRTTFATASGKSVKPSFHVARGVAGGSGAASSSGLTGEQAYFDCRNTSCGDRTGNMGASSSSSSLSHARRPLSRQSAVAPVMNTEVSSLLARGQPTSRASSSSSMTTFTSSKRRSGKTIEIDLLTP